MYWTRLLEFQLMPNLFNALGLATVDWGVIAVFVCPDSCVQDAFASEVVFVQASV